MSRSVAGVLRVRANRLILLGVRPVPGPSRGSSLHLIGVSNREKGQAAIMHKPIIVLRTVAGGSATNLPIGWTDT
jgi:hypothetical protein